MGCARSLDRTAADQVMARGSSPWLAAIAAIVAAAPALTSSRTITVFATRQFEVPVPTGWKFEDKNEDPSTEIRTIVLTDPKEDVQLSVSFVPDPEIELASRAALEKRSRQVFAFYLATSVEKDIPLTFFETPGSLGVFASFTDGHLDPKKIPKDEKLISTTGFRSWKGTYVLFTLLSNDKTSPAYKTALDLVRSGIRQIKAPVAF